MSAPLPAGHAARPDCPRVLLREALRAHPHQSRADGMERLPKALDDGRPTTADVLRHAAPAPAALAFLTATDISYRPAVPRWPLPHREAVDLVREGLGSDPEAWADALHRLRDFTGTLPELISDSAG